MWHRSRAESEHYEAELFDMGSAVRRAFVLLSRSRGWRSIGPSFQRNLGGSSEVPDPRNPSRLIPRMPGSPCLYSGYWQRTYRWMPVRGMTWDDVSPTTTSVAPSRMSVSQECCNLEVAAPEPFPYVHRCSHDVSWWLLLDPLRQIVVIALVDDVSRGPMLAYAVIVCPYMPEVAELNRNAWV